MCLPYQLGQVHSAAAETVFHLSLEFRVGFLFKLASSGSAFRLVLGTPIYRATGILDRIANDLDDLFQ